MRRITALPSNEKCSCFILANFVLLLKIIVFRDETMIIMYLQLVWSLTEEELGEGEPVFEWRPKGNYLAVAGWNNSVKLYDRSGNLIDELLLPG
ncbi:unnamed protein product [Onchocerca flexuosa]|uniref:ANAPC4_WD40 domain-containing protein n=1 Tax=Onchocerca flexuosa TaxID=387005 RepID=A0A183HU11_9BILA|nr:unnamed protein product [Onchocerca flexuosa]